MILFSNCFIKPQAKLPLYLLFDPYREWRDLTPMQEKYLIQIRPPGDVMPDAFREMVLLQNATNAAILFDDTFSE